MIEPVGLRRAASRASRSTTAVELALNVFAAAGALLVVRLLLLILDVSARVWAGMTVYRITNPMVRPIEFIPGAQRHVIGAASLADVTAIAILLMVPLWLIARSRGDHVSG